MIRLSNKFRPKQGFAHFFHLAIVALLPLIVFGLVRQELFGVALAIILLSKWRIFAIKPRHWLAHLRTNAVDIIFSLSMLAFMANTPLIMVQLLWVLVYEAWVLYLKPGSTPLKVTAQALISQLAGLIALFVAFEEVPIAVFIIGTAAILYYCARHFFASFQEPNYHSFVWSWTLFGASLVWILSHWLVFYGPVAQVAIVLSVIGSGLAALYYLHETNNLSKLVRRQVVFIIFAVVTVLLTLSDWGSRTI